MIWKLPDILLELTYTSAIISTVKIFTGNQPRAEECIHMAGIKDIANLAGVSIGTVDRVLHNRGRCNEDTRKKVLAAMHKLKYKPNLLARNLKLNTSYTIAVLQAKSGQDQGYWQVAATGIEYAQSELASFNIDIELIPFDRNNPKDFQRAAKSAKKCNAVLLTPILPEQSAKFISDNPDLPVATFDSYLEEEGLIQSLYQDGFTGGATAAGLMRMSLPKEAQTAVIAYETHNPNIMRRVEGFCAGLTDAGYKRPECFNIPETVAYTKLEKYLTDHNINLTAYDGIFIAKTGTAKYAKLLNQAKKKCFIIGYDLVEQNITALKNGMLSALISQDTPGQVFRGIKTLADLLLFNQQPNQSTIRMPADIITAANVDTYQLFHQYHNREAKPIT